MDLPTPCPAPKQSCMSQKLRIASWNINSVRARIDIVERFLREEEPDILCLQETKVANDIFPEGIFRQLGYRHIIINGQPAYHGVATISPVPIHNRTVNDWQANGEARHVAVELENGVQLNNVYIPAGGDIPDRDENVKFGQKLDFFDRMIAWSANVKEKAILTGDFNVAPLEHDVWSHKQLQNVVSHTDIEIEILDRLKQASNWVDLAREFVPADEKLYTWWSYRAQDWAASDRGRRLDHMWVTPDLKDKALSHNVHRASRSWAKPSDHAPIITDFAF